MPTFTLNTLSTISATQRKRAARARRPQSKAFWAAFEYRHMVAVATAQALEQSAPLSVLQPRRAPAYRGAHPHRIRSVGISHGLCVVVTNAYRVHLTTARLSPTIPTVGHDHGPVFES